MGILQWFMREQRRIQGLLDCYLRQWASCVEAFHAAWQTYLEEGPNERFEFMVEQTHKAESRADDLRRQIELEMYGKALLPESRGDILGVLESADRLLTDAEWALYHITLEDLVIPPALQGQFNQLVSVVCRCCEQLELAVRAVLVESRAPNLRQQVHRVDLLESESDHLQRSLIREIFALDMGAGRKLLLKEVVMCMAQICDGAEAVAHRVELVSVKRRV